MAGIQDKRRRFLLLLAMLALLITANTIFFAVKFAAAQQTLEDPKPQLTQQEQNEKAVINSILRLGDFSTAAATSNGNTSIIVFLGASEMKQPFEDEIDDVASLYNYTLFIYEYMPQPESQLLIVLVEEKQEPEANSTDHKTTVKDSTGAMIQL